MEAQRPRFQLTGCKFWKEYLILLYLKVLLMSYPICNTCLCWPWGASFLGNENNFLGLKDDQSTQIVVRWQILSRTAFRCMIQLDQCKNCKLPFAILNTTKLIFASYAIFWVIRRSAKWFTKCFAFLLHLENKGRNYQRDDTIKIQEFVSICISKLFVRMYYVCL